MEPRASMLSRLAVWASLSYSVLVLVLGVLTAVGFVTNESPEPVTLRDISDAAAALALLALVWLLFYVPWLLIWPLSSRRVPSIESRRIGVVLATLVVALLGGTGFGVLGPDIFHTVRWLEIVLSLLATVVLPWGALLLPRMVVRRLRPGMLRAADIAAEHGAERDVRPGI